MSATIREQRAARAASEREPRPVATLDDVFDCIDAVRANVIKAWFCRGDDSDTLPEGLLNALSELHYVEHYLGDCGVMRDGPEPSAMGVPSDIVPVANNVTENLKKMRDRVEMVFEHDRAGERAEFLTDVAEMHSLIGACEGLLDELRASATGKAKVST